MATTPVSKTIDQLETLANPTRSTKLIVGSGNKLYANLLSSLFALITKADIGLQNVDNTSDAEKPVSQLQAQAIGTRASQQALDALAQQMVDKASQEDLDALAQAAQNFVTSQQLTAALQNKADVDQTWQIENIENLTQILAGKAASGHGHAQASIVNLVDDLNAIRTSILGKAPTNHQHDAAQITGLQQLVADIINDLPNLGSVSSGENQW